jgi:hypothetical protein
MAQFEMTCRQIAEKLVLSVKEVQWAEESALRKLRKRPDCKELLVTLVENGTFDAYEVQDTQNNP